MGWVLALGGCGGFSSGGPPGLEPPGIPDFTRPEHQGAVKGTLRIEEGFAAEFLASLPAGRRSPDEKAATLGDLFQKVKVEFAGVRRRRLAALARDGAFAAEELPDGEYRASVLLDDRLLVAFPVPVQMRETTEVKIQVVGFDRADLDRDGSRTDLAVEVDVATGPGGARRTRRIAADGSVRTRLANGGTDYLLPGGVVRREQPGRGATFHRDHDLDGILDEDDPDFRRVRSKVTPVSDDDLLAGRAFPPLIREAKVTGLYGAERIADVAEVTAELAQDFAGAPLEVVARFYGEDGTHWSLPLRDDGGSADTLPEWPGHQPSGDDTLGDGVYRHLVPIDSTTEALIYNRQVVVEAVDPEGRRSNRFSFVLYQSPAGRTAGTTVPNHAEHDWSLVREVEVQAQPGRSGAEVFARIQAGGDLGGAVATLVGPGSFRRVFAPESGSGAPGGFAWVAGPAPLVDRGTFYVILGIPGERVFYAGRFLEAPQGGRPPRTGG